MAIGTALNNGVSGLNSFGQAISVVSDNIANANTTAFKSNSVHFGDLVNLYYSIFGGGGEASGTGSKVLGTEADFAQGSLLARSNWSDLALSGDGFFKVTDPATSNEFFTRDGSFHLDKNGVLVNSLGYKVQGQTTYTPPTPPATVGTWSNVGDVKVTTATDYSSIRVDQNGEVIGVKPDGSETKLAKVELTTFSNKNGLIRHGNNLYTAGPDVGASFDNTTVGNEKLFGTVQDYNLEGSNVDLSKEMVDMIIYQASYNANSKTITTARDMLDISVNMVR